MYEIFPQNSRIETLTSELEAGVTCIEEKLEMIEIGINLLQLDTKAAILNNQKLSESTEISN